MTLAGLQDPLCKKPSPTGCSGESLRLRSGSAMPRTLGRPCPVRRWAGLNLCSSGSCGCRVPVKRCVGTDPATRLVVKCRGGESVRPGRFTAAGTAELGDVGCGWGGCPGSSQRFCETGPGDWGCRLHVGNGAADPAAAPRLPPSLWRASACSRRPGASSAGRWGRGLALQGCRSGRPSFAAGASLASLPSQSQSSVGPPQPPPFPGRAHLSLFCRESCTLQSAVS